MPQTDRASAFVDDPVKIVISTPYLGKIPGPLIFRHNFIKTALISIILGLLGAENLCLVLN